MERIASRVHRLTLQRVSANFSPFGNRSSASARLRAWRLAEELRLRGHDATVNGQDLKAIEVFQKVRPFERLTSARRRNAFVIYDFDDNYLLEGVGTRDDILRFINLVDMVTVGSPDLLEAVTPYHDRVYLFENPLDVDDGVMPRSATGWRGRIGWFGNRTNLTALESLALQYAVTTVTRDGDVEWRLETVDEVTRGFDLILIPVLLDDWTRSKNANRLLKSVALGVPFLASRTEEHERTVDDLGLPRYLLVDAGEDWDAAIDRVRDQFEDIEQQILTARDLAVARFGIRTTAVAWATAVQEGMAAPAESAGFGIPPWSEEARLALAATDVVVLNENEAEFAHATLETVDRSGVELGSLTVVSAHELGTTSSVANQERRVVDSHDDFFEVYPRVAEAAMSAESHHVLFLRGGVRLLSGFFHEMGQEDAADVHVYREQLVSPGGEALADPPPLTLEQLVLRPFTPNALTISRDLLARAGGMNATHLSYASWDLLLRIYQLPDVTVSYHSTPLLLVDPRLSRRHTVQSYSVWAATHCPVVFQNLPGHIQEWRRLSYTLHAGIVGEHEALFSSRVQAAVPALLDRMLALEGEKSLLRERLVKVERDKRKAQDALNASARTRAVTADRSEAAGTQLVTTRGTPPAHWGWAPVRGTWRVLRRLVPRRVRAGLYARLRRPYLRAFPERDPQRVQP